MQQAKIYPSRDDLGKTLIGLAKEEIQRHSGIPDIETLKPVFDSKFGELLKGYGLFDLGVLIKRNEVIMEAAKRKQVASIVKLTQAFDAYLKNKKEEKEKKTREFLAKRLQKMAA
ncbi:MAG: hypothetical protein V1690_00025 [Candidatus Moraniibacteriota bacterium]